MPHQPEVLLDDPRLHLSMGDPQPVLAGGLQPFMMATRTGTLAVQAQLPERVPPDPGIIYPFVLDTVVSRDEGATWEPFCRMPRDNRLILEGGMTQLQDGTVIALDTYVRPGTRPGEDRGQLFYSTDDWRTLQGPVAITFNLPGVNFHGSTGDDGSPHPAVRLHRRILELPGGDLLTTLYGWLDGDREPAAYMPTMKKSRVLLLRSANRGRHWELVSTVAADPAVGTEGFDEGVLARLGHGPKPGRLICLMRTGRELREAVSDDDGRTWSPAVPRVFADLDVYRTEKWVEMFRDVKDRHGRLVADNPVELVGAVVNPDLIELRGGVLVAAFGLRVPPRVCWPHAQHPWNGNYLACSLDHGATWSHVVRLTSGVPTTHYMTIEELPGTNRLYCVHDLGFWDEPAGRRVVGRTVQIALAGT
jgi:hypothetical protein